MTRSPCPCGGPRPYDACCEPLHLGLEFPRTARQLMRSRYSAFCLGKADYLVATLHPSRRQATDSEELTRTLAATRWTHLHILASDLGGEDDETGEVEFVALYEEGGVSKKLHERSCFVREDGRWFYLSGQFEDLRPLPRPGRNDPCWCEM